MQHTAPDYSTKYKMATIFGQIDSGELAARLGSINTFDRRGNVVFMDAFEDGFLNWSKLVDGTGAAVNLSTFTAKTGSTSVKCRTGNSTGDYAGIRKFIPYPVLSPIGCELSFQNTTAITYWELILGLYDGTHFTSARLYIDPINSRIRIFVPVTGYVDVITDIDLHIAANMFHTIKIVGDFSTGKYVRAIVNNYSVDLSAHTLRSEDDPTGSHIMIEFQGYTNIDASRDYYIDSVIVTQNEP